MSNIIKKHIARTGILETISERPNWAIDRGRKLITSPALPEPGRI